MIIQALPRENVQQESSATTGSISSVSNHGTVAQEGQTSWLAILGVFAAICACTWAMLKLSLL